MRRTSVIQPRDIGMFSDSIRPSALLMPYQPYENKRASLAERTQSIEQLRKSGELTVYPAVG